MAGSYNHVVTDSGQLRTKSFSDLIENLGDAQEAIEEMYGMIWVLAEGSAFLVSDARHRSAQGMKLSPGREPR
jgi:hypothetical protein